MKFTLANGLRVVIAREPDRPVVCTAVLYDVGSRSEPRERTGFAHLFEHLMFQGSANAPSGAYAKVVQGAGGTFNGATRLDSTRYYTAMPPGSLAEMLACEADRMAAPLLTEENLRRQVGVVSAEIRTTVLGNPYGDFPWTRLPAVLFDRFANTHDGYGSFEDLHAATVEDAQDFFERYYCPANAVLCVAGDIDPDEAAELVHREFGRIPHRPAPQTPELSEPWPTEPRSSTYVDPLAPMPAFAMGWRVPDPLGPLADYLPYLLVGDLLSAGEGSRLARRLIRRDRTAAQVSGQIGVLGDPFDVRDPTMLIVSVLHPLGTPAAPAQAAVTDEIERLAAEGPSETELDEAKAIMSAHLARKLDPPLARTVQLATFALYRDDPWLIDELTQHIAKVTVNDVRSAAGALAAQPASTLFLRTKDCAA